MAFHSAVDHLFRFTCVVLDELLHKNGLGPHTCACAPVGCPLLAEASGLESLSSEAHFLKTNSLS